MSKLFGKWISKDFNNLEHSGDDLKVKFSDAEAADSNKVWSSEKISTVSGVLQTDIDTRAVSGGSEHDGFSDYVGDEHIDHSGVSVTAGTGLTGGGTIESNRTLNVDVGITNDKIVQMDDADAEDGDYAKLTASGIEGRGAAEVREDLDLEAGTDFYSKTAEDTWRSSVTQTEMGYLDGVESDIQDQLDDRYTKAEVDTISGSLNDKITVVGGVDGVEYITISAGDISNKYTTLAQTPITPEDTMLDIIGGGAQLYTTDYTVVSGTLLNWNGLGIDGILEADDVMRVSYTYST